MIVVRGGVGQHGHGLGAYSKDAVRTFYAVFYEGVEELLIGRGWQDIPWRHFGVLRLVAGKKDALALLLASPTRYQPWAAFAAIGTTAVNDQGLFP